MTGTLYGIGVGPGDPELLTLKAARLIAACPVIAYPMANGEPSLARDIAGSHIQRAAEERPFALPMSPDPKVAQAAYDSLAQSLQACLSAGKDVALLCEGDPLFYGSFSEVMHRLDRRTPIEVVPGISSAHAAAAVLKMPIVRRNASWSVLPATLPDADLTARLQTADAAAILKLGRHFWRVRALLDRLDLTRRAAYCERVGQAGEKVLPLAQMNTGPAPYFSLILIPVQTQ